MEWDFVLKDISWVHLWIGQNNGNSLTGVGNVHRKQPKISQDQPSAQDTHYERNTWKVYVCLLYMGKVFGDFLPGFCVVIFWSQRFSKWSIICMPKKLFWATLTPIFPKELGDTAQVNTRKQFSTILFFSCLDVKITIAPNLLHQKRRAFWKRKFGNVCSQAICFSGHFPELHWSFHIYKLSCKAEKVGVHSHNTQTK